MKTITIHTMYRDSCNYKNNDSSHFSNPNNIPLVDIIAAFKDKNLLDEPIMVQDYGIPSISPVSNEFVPLSYGSEDHPYCEIIDIEVGPDNHGDWEGEIDHVLRLVADDGAKDGIELRKQEARTTLKDALNELGEGKEETGNEITINLPFTYEIGEEGPVSGNVINTVEDAKAEVQAEIDNGLSGELYMTVGEPSQLPKPRIVI